MVGVRSASDRMMVCDLPPLVPSPPPGVWPSVVSPGAPQGLLRRSRDVNGCRRFVAKKHISACLSQQLGIMSLISGLLRQPEGEASDASVSFSPLPSHRTWGRL